MNYQCFSEHCVDETVAYCLCEGIPSLFCATDSLEHIRIYGDHTLLDIETFPLSQTQIFLLEVNNVKISLKIAKESLFSKSSQLAELINNSIQVSKIVINKLIDDCDELLRLSLQDENTQVINHELIFSKLASDRIQINLDWNDEMIENCSHLLNLIKQTLDISNLCKNQIMLLKESQHLNTCNLDLFKTRIKKKNCGPEDHDSFKNEIIFFKGETKQLNIMNLNSLETQIEVLNSLPENIIRAISICELPNKSKFCYGNGSGLTFIIDQDKNIILLPNGKGNSVLDSKYYNNFVYAIGGGNKLAEKYNLVENKWESCAPIPDDYEFYCSRSALLGDQLVIVDVCFGKVIHYDIYRNNYQELAGINLEEGWILKFAFTGGNRVYIGEHQKNVYESGETDLTRWTRISTTNPITDNYQISYYSLINESVYFLNLDFNLYEFKLRTKDLKLIENHDLE